MSDYGIPDLEAMANAMLEELLAEFRAVPKQPENAYIRAQGYMDIIRAELAARQRANCLAEAWRIASTDLGLSIGTTGCVLTDDDGGAHRYVVHVKDFGGPNGTICSVASSVDAMLQLLATEAGYFHSALGKSYEVYDRELFVSTLDDWQWFGSGGPPAWYSGTPWSQ